MLLYMRAIRDNTLAATLPYLAFTPVITALAAWLLLGEQISFIGLSGILLVMAGAYSIHPRHGRGWLVPLRAIARDVGARLMLAVALIYSLTAVLGKGALQYAEGISFGALYFALLGLASVCVFSWRDTRRVFALKEKPWQQYLAAFFMALMVFTHFLAGESRGRLHDQRQARKPLVWDCVWGLVAW